jgi:hypothetical protein
MAHYQTVVNDSQVTQMAVMHMVLVGRAQGHARHHAIVERACADRRALALRDSSGSATRHGGVQARHKSGFLRERFPALGGRSLVRALHGWRGKGCAGGPVRATSAVAAARRLPCGAYMDASRVARGVLQVLASRINCCLISGLLVQSGHRPAAGLDGHSRGRSHISLAGFAWRSPPHRIGFSNPRSDRSPSLASPLSRTRCGVCHSVR